MGPEGPLGCSLSGQKGDDCGAMGSGVSCTAAKLTVKHSGFLPVYVSVHACVHMDKHRGRKTTSSVSSHTHSTFSETQGPSLAWSLPGVLSHLASKFCGSTCFCVLCGGVTGVCHHVQCF